MASQPTLKLTLIVSLFILAVVSLFAPYVWRDFASSNANSQNQYRTVYQEESLVAGKSFPDFKLPDVNGKRFSLADFKGKYLLVNFWATWCPPCLAELPAFEKLNQKFKEKDFVIIAIAEDVPEKLLDIKKIIEVNKLSFLVLHDSKMELPEKLSLTGFPETFFIDPNGNFLKVLDPGTNQESIRILSDRPWDSKEYQNLINNILQRKSDSRNN